MNILVFNCGSSSENFKILKQSGTGEVEVVMWGKAKNVATKTQAGSKIDWTISETKATVSKAIDLSSHRQAAREIISIIKDNNIQVDAIGHRFAHGGPLFDQTVKIDQDIMKKLDACAHYAPIHNPNSYSVIEVCFELLPGVSQYVVFDTSFHATMPEVSTQYAIPKELAEKYGFRKYGFHGISYQYVSKKVSALLNKPLQSLNLIICHLGTGGSSVVAIRNGKSLDTSMGFTPLPGLVMSTRCGDIDPEILLEMIRDGMSADEVSKILNSKSGLIGLSGYSSNLIEIIEASEKGDNNCKLAYDSYAHRLKIYLGAYTWLLNGADAVIFTDDIGVRAWQLREKVCADVSNLGIEMDNEANKNAAFNQPSCVSSPKSKTQIWVIPTDEERVVFDEVLKQF